MPVVILDYASRHNRSDRGGPMSRWVAAMGVAVVMVGGSVAGAQGTDFTPSAEYHLCSADSADQCVHDYYTDSAVQFRVGLGQDQGEEELENITLKFAPGFRFPKDAQIPDGERLGDAHIEIDSGPGCMGETGTAP